MRADASVRREGNREERLAPPDFDALARAYRWMEWASFGPFLWWCRCAFLDEMRASRRALVIGDGDGRFTARLLGELAGVRVDAVDASPSMLRSLARRAGAGAPRLRTQCIDAREWSAGGKTYDLIVTHFFLDCLTTAEVRELARRLRAAAAPGAAWVVSEFAVPGNRFGRFVAGPVVALLYGAFRVLTGLRVKQLPDYAAALGASGFRLRRRRAWLAGLLASEVWEAA